MKRYKFGFTLIEIIISVIISVIVLMFLFTIVSNVIEEVDYNNKQSNILSSYNDFFKKIEGYRSVFLSGQVLIDNLSGSGFDVMMLKNNKSTKGVLFGVVNKANLKLETNSGYNYIYDRVLGYREISSGEILDLETTPNNVFDYLFFEDKLFEALKVKDFQVDYYNSGTILNIDLGINIGYMKGLDGELFKDIGTDDIINYNLNF